MAAFPGAVATFLGFSASHTLSQDQHAAQHNLEQGEVVATQSKLGTGASTPTANSVLVSTSNSTSAWSQVSLTTMVSGILPVSNGGTGTNTSTGSGSTVLSTSPGITTPSIATPTISGGGSWSGSPTLSTPTIADFTNANHAHDSTAHGGQLGFAALLSTIFSGQIVTDTNPGSAGGTRNFLNLGGLKISWGTTAALSLSAAQQATAVVTFPTTYTTAPDVIANGGQHVTTVAISGSVNSAPNTTAVTVQVISTTGTNQTGSVKVSWLAIGV